MNSRVHEHVQCRQTTKLNDFIVISTYKVPMLICYYSQNNYVIDILKKAKKGHYHATLQHTMCHTKTKIIRALTYECLT